KELPWCGGWQLPMDDRALRLRAANDDVGALREWLLAACKSGVVTRQEIASMIPVAVLDVRREHAILDLCASPGSKTSQAIDMMFSGKSSSLADAGFVVANELCEKRAYILAKRCSELSSASSCVLVTSHRAQIFPSSVNDGTGEFDRIICDVPCSGDGTFRKYRDKWRHWHHFQGRQLHSLQLQIALRSIALLKVGGLVSYSTCSLNPMEDESVVAALLERCGGAVELVPCRHHLGDFVTARGMRSWKVLDDDCCEIPSYEAARERLGAGGKRYRRTMWPQGERADLEHCLRLYPHLNDTGGFFVALL
ncbi:hypothetical protein GUITHDRAFT_55503, partial [Guillardia theta CCMP2712]